MWLCTGTADIKISADIFQDIMMIMCIMLEGEIRNVKNRCSTIHNEEHQLFLTFLCHYLWKYISRNSGKFACIVWCCYYVHSLCKHCLRKDNNRPRLPEKCKSAWNVAKSIFVELFRCHIVNYCPINRRKFWRRLFTAYNSFIGRSNCERSLAALTHLVSAVLVFIVRTDRHI